MANIVVGMHNFLLKKDGLDNCPPFYSSFINGLKKAGNNVFCFQFGYKLQEETEQIPEIYLKKIKEINPDLFILFNNHFWDITDEFNVPIVVFDVDSPNHYCNLKKIKNNISKYKFIVSQKSGIISTSEITGAKKESICYIAPFSELQAKNISQNINISFLGSHWCWNDFPDVVNFIKSKPSFKERETAKKAYVAFQNYPFIDLEETYKRNKLESEKKLAFKNLVVGRGRISGLKRLRYLTEISDLGLEIRGQSWLNSIMLQAFPEVVLSYSLEPVNNIQQVESFLNCSKISLNTKHIQAQSGFSWRVCDILASNACLVTEPTSDLKDFGFKVPTFTSPAELREQCVRLLNNPNLREDIVAHSQELINKNHRFSNILPIIENFLNIKLSTGLVGSLENIHIFKETASTNQNKEQTISPNHFPCVSTSNLNIKQKLCYKVSKYFFCLANE